MDFWERLDQLIEARGKSRKTVADAVGIAPNTIATWKIRQTYPDARVALLIAKNLGVTMEHLLEGSDLPEEWLRENREFLDHLRILPSADFRAIKAQVAERAQAIQTPSPWQMYCNFERVVTQMGSRISPEERAGFEQTMFALKRIPEVQAELAKREKARARARDKDDYGY